MIGENKLLYIVKNLMPTNPNLEFKFHMVFKITSFESAQKLLAIDGINAVDLWLYTKNSYPSF